MAITVSDEFKALWRQKVGTEIQHRVRYKRRYWNGAAFVHETDWKVLNQGQFSRIGVIPQQLDVPRQNIFRASVFSIFVPNTEHEWKQLTTAPSKFAADATATLGYKAHRSKVQVQTGYVLADGTTEWVTRFTGLLLRVRPAGMAEAELIVTSNDLLLEQADAEEVSTTVTLENCIPAVGDGAVTEFESTSTGVDHPTDLQVNAVSQVEGSAYRSSNQNEVASAGNTGRLKLDITPAPPAAQTVKVSLKKWLADQAIEDLIELLCDEAGIGSGNRTINPVLYAGGVSSSKTIDTQAQWAAGSVLTNIDTAAEDGSIFGPWVLFDNFADGDIASNPAWAIQYENGNTTFTVESNKLRAFSGGGGSPNQGFVQVASTQAVGAWLIKASLEYLSALSDLDQGVTYAFLLTGAAPGGQLTGYGLAFKYDAGIYGNNRVVLERYDNQDFVLGTILADCGAVPSPGDHYWQITRNASGVMRVYMDGTLVGTATDNTYTSSAYMGVSINAPFADSTVQLDIAGIWKSPTIDNTTHSNAPAIFESAEQDLLAAPIAWGTLDRTVELNGGTVVYKTAVASSSGGVYDAYVEIAADGQINSALKRYLKIRAEITPGTAHLPETMPEVQKLVAHYSTDGVFIALANFRGKTCAAAIERLTQIADYYRGFDEEGDFFFRSKVATGGALLHLTQDNGIVSVMEYDDGIPDRVYTIGRVRSGGFVASYSCADAGEAAPSPQDEHGDVVMDEDLDDILLANDADLRTARAQAIHDNNHEPPLRLRLMIWDIPWAQLTDILRISLYDDPLLRQTQMDDPLFSLDGRVAAGEAQNVLVRDTDMQILEYKFNPETNQAEVLVEAI